jgi:hypothetical protein
MTPAPGLQDLIETVERDAPDSDALTLLGTASSVVAEIEDVGDALLGHFVDRCRRHGHSWSEISTALGVSKQAAHKRFSSPAPTLERFTPRARRTTDAASASARALGHDFVGTEHILLGLFAEPEALAARALAEAGIDRAAVQSRVLEALPRGEALLDNPLYIPQASQALQNALREALELGHNYIGTEHVLLALLRDGDAPAGRILAELGVSLPSTLSRLLEMVNATAGKAGPHSP